MYIYNIHIWIYEYIYIYIYMYGYMNIYIYICIYILYVYTYNCHLKLYSYTASEHLSLLLQSHWRLPLPGCCRGGGGVRCGGTGCNDISAGALGAIGASSTEPGLKRWKRWELFLVISMFFSFWGLVPMIFNDFQWFPMLYFDLKLILFSIF